MDEDEQLEREKLKEFIRNMDNPIESGFICAPYIPLYITSSTFTSSKVELLSRCVRNIDYKNFMVHEL
jgi:hypothetical protein